MAAFSARACFALLLLRTACAYHPDLQLTGACAAKSYLNGLLYRFAGRTKSGAPYYKATTANEYLYWDPDCGGGGDGTARWVLDNNEPDTEALRDLDRDGLCEYHARIDSTSHIFPPDVDFWYMSCGGAEPTKLLLTLAAITTTQTTTSSTRTTITSSSTLTTTTRTTTSKTTTSRSTTTTSRTTTSRTTTSKTTTSRTSTETETRTRTSTSTSRTGTTTTDTVTTSRTRTTTSKTTTSRTTSTTITTSYTGSSTTTTIMILRLTGACAYKNFLNDLTFVEEGKSASGARWFKAVEAEQYLYYDFDCDGGSNGQKRWIIDNTMPFPTHVEDLDQDGGCNYHARLDSDDIYGPPHVAKWQMWCGLGWTDATLHLDDAPDYRFDDGLDYSHSLKLRGLFDTCPQKAFLDNMQFDLQGFTASGAPYFKTEGSENYIYYDHHCSGNLQGSARWIIDSDKPSLTRDFDLDGDYNCSYLARVKSLDTEMPPKGAMWKVECGSEWQDLWVALIRLPMTSTTLTATATTTVSTTTTKRPKVVINAAAGQRPVVLALLLAGLAVVAPSRA